MSPPHDNDVSTISDCSQNVTNSKNCIAVYYGSQTGCAESIAKRIQQDAEEKGYESSVNPLNTFPKREEKFDMNTLFIIVCSTTGNGDPPDNASRFWRILKRRSNSNTMLSSIQYTVLGLGDTNYDKFCHMGKSIDKRVRELGAKSFYPMGACDEAMGLEDSVEPWIDGLWKILSTMLKSESEELINEKFPQVMNPPPAPIEENQVSKASNMEVNIPKEKKLSIHSQEKNSIIQNGKDIQSILPKGIISYDKMFEGFQTMENVAEYPKFRDATFQIEIMQFENKIDQNNEKNVKNLVKTTAYATASSIMSIKSNEDIKDCDMKTYQMGTIVEAKYLTTPESSRRVLYLEIESQDIEYSPGDAIGIKCPNRSEIVQYMIQRLNLNSQERIQILPGKKKSKKFNQTTSVSTIPSGLTIEEIFLHYVELNTIPRKAMLRTLAEYCTKDQDKACLLHLSSKLGKKEYQMFIEQQQLTLPEILHFFPSCQPPLNHILDILPTLMPRYYSIASSPLHQPNRFSLALTIVEYELYLTSFDSIIRRFGLCSNYLESICQSMLNTNIEEKKIKIPFCRRETAEFILPNNPKDPMILIGPGTGVAPFIGFLQHRYYEKLQIKHNTNDLNEINPLIYLFFGCRKRTEDWIFEKDMKFYKDEYILTEFYTAFSREQEDKYYVIHDILKHGEKISNCILNENAYIYVCGDGMKMAKDVHDTLILLFQQYHQMTEEEAQHTLNSLMKNQHYVRDIWS